MDFCQLARDKYVVLNMSLLKTELVSNVNWRFEIWLKTSEVAVKRYRKNGDLL